MAKKQTAPRPSIEVKLTWGIKEIPETVRKARASKYLAILEALAKKPGRPALMGTFPERTATSLIVSIKHAAKQTPEPLRYRFSGRRRNDDVTQYDVYGMYSAEPVAPAATVPVQKPKRKYTKRIVAGATPVPLDEPEVTDAELDAKFPDVDTLKD